jgi:hypothetical protein
VQAFAAGHDTPFMSTLAPWAGSGAACWLQAVPFQRSYNGTSWPPDEVVVVV